MLKRGNWTLAPAENNSPGKKQDAGNVTIQTKEGVRLLRERFPE